MPESNDNGIAGQLRVHEIIPAGHITLARHKLAMLMTNGNQFENLNKRACSKISLVA